MLRYHSTNRELTGGFRGDVSFAEALFRGLAPDEGLFMPVSIPQLSPDRLRELEGAPYHVVAAVVLQKFLEGEIDRDLVESVSKDAFDFEVPIERLGERVELLHLDRGPTASFKDFAARFMARMMSELRTAGQEICILVATSGDTGAAVGEAFRGVEGMRVFVLYPAAEVSQVQKKTLDGIGENVHALAVEGKFDDCQRFVKRAFADPDLTGLNLTSANSINIGRVLPQIVFYVYACVATAGREPIVVAVPSGNFGNSLGCELARRMGLPVERLILATNDNDEVPRFLETGTYAKIEPSIDCLSNAMNVGNPSNLARFFDLYGGTLTSDGTVERAPDLVRMRENLYSVSVTDAQTEETIRRAHESYGTIIEPHAAVGLCALSRYFDEHGLRKAVAVETAHPAKFPEIVERVLGARPAPTAALGRISRRKGSAHLLENRYAAFKQFLLGE